MNIALSIIVVLMIVLYFYLDNLNKSLKRMKVRIKTHENKLDTYEKGLYAVMREVDKR